MVTAFAEVPPNRGDMTVAQFAENYNFLAEYYGIDSGQYLDRDGLWAANKTDGTFIINLGGVETPDFEYTLKDGYINEIRMTVEVTDSEDWIGSFGNELTVSYTHLDVYKRQRISWCPGWGWKALRTVA